MSTADTIAPEHFLPLGHHRFGRLARLIFLNIVRRERLGRNFQLHLREHWLGHQWGATYGNGDCHIDLEITDPRTYPALVWGGSKGMGRSYVNGLWTTTTLTELVRFLFQATQPMRLFQDKWTRRFEPLLRWHRPAPSKVRDRENIHAHYDLSNEFFELMLDDTMAYSCAVFANPQTSLYDAQVEKFDRLCRKLNLRPDDHLLEIGTGWGGLAIHAARHYGCRVTTTTISENQRVAAESKIAAAGLSEQITVLGTHYADLEGTYDAIVSVEMIEAVDWRKYREFFGDLATLLKPDGRLAMQAITMNDQSFDRAKRQEDFIRDLIFPGGCLPSIEAILRTTRDVTDFTLVDVEDIGLHYAHTLDLWDQRVDENYEAIQALGFDERFRRLWRLYLRYCEAAFLERHISDVQLLFHRRATPQVLAARAV